jgi:Concanavalin A-like lectin/glucanases superfamily
VSLRRAGADRAGAALQLADEAVERRHRLLVAAAAAWAACLLYLGLASRLPSIGLVDGTELSSWGHALGTLVLAVLLYLIVVSSGTQPPRRAALAVAVAATLFGVAIEGLQGLGGDRDPSIADALLDAAGAVVAVTVLSRARLPLRATSRYATWGTAVLVTGVVAAVVFLPPPETDQTECSTAAVAQPERAALSSAATSGRGGRGPVALYDFRAGDGRVVADVSGVAPALDLRLVGSEVRWLDGQGLRFRGGAARSDGPAAKLAEASARTGELTLEAWVRSGDLAQKGPTRIATVSGGIERDQVNVHLGQEGQALSVRLRATCGRFNWWTVPDVFTSRAAPVHVAVTFAEGVERTYANGRLVDAVRLDGRLGSWDPDYPLVIGNEATLDRPLFGDVLLVAVHDRALSAAEVAQNAMADPFAQRDA